LKYSIEPRLNRLIAAGQQHLLCNGLKGLEKESLRVTPDARIAQTPHPAGLGAALTHPYITTDYSEALIELITPAFSDSADTLAFLGDLHRFVYQSLGDELLWPLSMPCEISGDESIPIAEYGTSNIGKMKHVYRRGLAWRYGRAMQAIAGVHFNYSLNEALWPVWHELNGRPGSLRDFIADQYFGLIRNVKRYGWLVLYAFGASPAMAKSFFKGREELTGRFREFDSATLYRPYATSLRMSDIGYRNDSQSELDISCNSLDEYVRSLARAVNTHYPPYEAIGIKVNGEYRQLNANILQISNEYYSLIRPKQVTESGERPVLALRRRGLRYVELRSVDLGGVHPVGVSIEQLRFLELFMLYCFLMESPPIVDQEKNECALNPLSVACCGRTPGYVLIRGGKDVSLLSWAAEMVAEIGKIASILDLVTGGNAYQDSVDLVRAMVDDPEATPSARMLEEMQWRSESFSELGMRQAELNKQALNVKSLPADRRREFELAADQSKLKQQAIEAGDDIDFEQFITRYFSQSLFEEVPEGDLRSAGAE
jgi:glutamate--cysteine ligase